VSKIEQSANISAAALQWVKETLNASQISVERMVVRREAWLVSIVTKAGAQERYFLRIDRNAQRGHPGKRGLKRETLLIGFLNDQTNIPAQRIVAWSDEHCIAIQSFEAGRAELHRAPQAEQHEVMLEFMAIMANMHLIDVKDVDIPEFEIPPDAPAHSLMELDAVDPQVNRHSSIDSTTILGTFGKSWLRHHVPEHVERTCLLQGDTGAGNFLFEAGRVTAVVDWEWAHFGDPMEDLGNVWLRDFFTPSCNGDLSVYFSRYAELAGLQLDLGKITYYLVHQLVRSVISLPRLTRAPDWRSTVALNLGYQALCDITLCEAMGLYHGVTRPQIEPLTLSTDSDSGELYRVIADQLEQGVAPDLNDAFARSLNAGAAEITRYLERRHVNGPRADELELQGINGILGERHQQLADARLALNLMLTNWRPDEAMEIALIEHCWGVASRNMTLMGPLVQRWDYCKLATVNV